MQINIGGKLRNLKYNQLALEEIIKSDISSISGMGASYTIVHAGLIAACYVAREKVDFTFENVCDWIDELIKTKEGVTGVTQAVEAFTISTAFKELIPITELRPEDKKKAVKKLPPKK